MKYIVALLVALCIAISAMLFSSTAFTTMEEDGLAVPTKAQLADQIHGDGEDIATKALSYGDVIYQSLLGYYVGEDRVHIDLSIPLYIDDGYSLMFWGEENTLITTRAELYESFSGLYLTDGHTYNRDLTQADSAEFILVTLPSGLYMNAQSAEFSGPLGKHTIRVNSILSLTEEALRWYSLEGDLLVYHEEEAVFGATLTIGGHTYRYTDLLDALGLIRKAMEEKPADESLLQEAEDLLTNEEDEDGDGEEDNDRHRPDRDRNNGDGDGDGEGAKAPHGGSSQPGGGHSNGAGGATAGGGSAGGVGTTGGSGSSGGGTGGTGGGSSDGGTAGGGDSGDGAEGDGDTGESSGQGKPGTGTDGDGNLPENPENPGENDGPEVSLPPSDESDPTFQYTAPKLTYEALEAWFYAVGADIHVEDPETNIIRSIDFAVYGDKTATGLPAKGSLTIGGKTYTTYPADSYDGTQTLFRRSYSSSYEDQLVALSTIEPGTTVYLEYSYRYFYREEKTENGETTVSLSRLRYESDLIEIQIPDVVPSQVEPVQSQWDTSFAAHPNAMELTNLTLANHAGSTYDPQLSTKDFREFFTNFKKNTLPYVSRYVITMTPADGSDPVVITTNQRTLDLTKAQKEGGTSYLSEQVLKSNTKYTYQVQAQDAYGNTLPLIANGSTAYTGTVFTQKSTPTVTMSQEKVLDADGQEDVERMKLIITVQDPDGALMRNKDLYLTLIDSQNNQNAVLNGTLDGAAIDASGSGVQQLVLPLPAVGQTSRTYEVVLDSLAYNFAYRAEVTGSVHLQPSDAAATDGTLAEQINVTLGTGRFTTARIGDGLVHFVSRIPSLRDTYGTISLEMQSDSTLSLLDMVDEFRVTITGPDGFQYVTTAALKDLSAPSSDYSYVAANNTMSVIAGSDANLTTGITLYGPQGNVQSTPWESILVHKLSGEGDEATYSKPMALWYELPKNLMMPNRNYTFKVEALAHKGGHTEPMEVKITGPSSFTTTKIIPVVHYSDMFLAADRAEFLGVWIEDPQNTILGGGTVQVMLSQGDNLLQMRTVTAYDLGDALIGQDQEKDYLEDGTIVPINLSFSGLSQGVEYKLEFIAPTYNETNQYSGLVPNKPLETRYIIGGSMLMGDLNLEELKNDEAHTGKFKATVNIKAQDAIGYLFRTGETGAVYAQLYRSDSIQLPDYQLEGKPYELKLTQTNEEDCQYRLVDEDGYDLILDALDPNEGWKMELYTYYQGDKIPLDEITFRTNGEYTTVRTHAELRTAIDNANDTKKNAPKNILVAADFTMEKAIPSRTVNGIVDFQGHKVTKYADSGGNSFLEVGKNGTVRNLAFEYPDVENFEIYRSIFGTISGTVENLVVITQGNTIMTSNYSLVGRTLSSTGVLRNFIIQLGGDMIISSLVDHNGAMFYDVYGLIENGYAYTVNRSDGLKIQRAVGGNSFTSGLLRRGASLRNVFFYMDSWYNTNYTSRFLAYHYVSGVNVENVYYVGDYYNYVENASNLYNSPRTDQYMLQNSCSTSAYRNIWSISTRDLTCSATAVNMGTVAQLYDTAWQSEVLNSAFDIENTVPMGYFPRLNLPVEMQKYQNYVHLPAMDTTTTVPKIVDDGWAEDMQWLVEENKDAAYSHDLDSGYIYLTFENFTNAKITDVEIKGLEVVRVLQPKETEASTAGQGQRPGTSLYDVVVQVRVGGSKPQYYSGYTVTKVTYSSGGTIREVEENYLTKRVEFWKEIQSVYDWAAINDSRDSMYWNYLVTEDLDFGESQARDIVIDRPTDAISYRYFRGKLHGLKSDGSAPVLSNISITNSATPNIIYYLYNTGTISNHALGEVKNLYFDNLTLAAAQGGFAAYTGVVGYNNGGIVENVIVKDGDIDGQGFMGGLVGYASGGLMKHCAVVDTTINDLRSSQNLYCGGLLGYSSSSTVEESYTRNVTITADKTAVVKGVGGALGYLDNGTIRNCYTHGTIQVSGNNVGGLIGLVGTPWMERCWTFVNINQDSGGKAGGITVSTHTQRRCVALGDVLSSGADICRAGQSDAFAYSGADVTGLTQTQVNATYEPNLTLVSGTQLATTDYWQDTINLGGAFTYEPVSRNCAPLLAWDVSNPEWKQQDISLPGTVAEPDLEVLYANYRENDAYKYSLQLRLTHPEVSHAQSYTFDTVDENGNPATVSKSFHQLIREQMMTANGGKGSFDGMDISQMALTPSENAPAQSVLEVAAGSDNYTTIINVKTNDITKALDAYRITVYYPSNASGTQFNSLYTVVGYTDSTGAQKINYWTIRSLNEWNTRMSEHGQTAENFIIAGNIDFGGATTIYNSLVINRLEGELDAEGAPLWTLGNLQYEGLSNGNPWFEKIYTNISGLRFQNLNFEFGYITAQRGLTGMVQAASEISNLKFDTVRMTVNQYARRYVGLFCDVTGNVTDITMKNVSLQDVKNGEYTGTYGNAVTSISSDNTRAGALVGHLGGNATNITAEDIRVDMPYTYNVGGIIGRGRIVGGTLTGLYVRGYELTGGMIGYWNGTGDCDTMTVTGKPGMNTVRGKRYVAGIANVYSNGTYQSDWHISGMEITAEGTGSTLDVGHVGGLSGYGYGFAVQDSSVTDCIIRGTRYVGGLTGMNSLNARRCVVSNCDIILANSSFANKVTSDVGAGGIAARMTTSRTVTDCVVQNCNIVGTVNAGGAIGVVSALTSPSTVTRIYVDAATVVTAGSYVNGTLVPDGINAGGLMGLAKAINLRYSASGATVQGKSNVGGAAGLITMAEGKLLTLMEQVYVNASVLATENYAGGFAGQVETVAPLYTSSLLTDCLVSARVSAPAAAYASAWMNRTGYSGDAGNVELYVYEGSTVNGTTVKSVIDALQPGENTTAAPLNASTGGYYTASLAQVQSTDFYTDSLSFTTIYWNMDHFADTGNVYMPYTTRYRENTTIPLAISPHVLTSSRIPFPEGIPGSTVTQPILVYSAGVNSVNIEGAPGQTITLGSGTAAASTTDSTDSGTTDSTDSTESTESGGETTVPTLVLDANGLGVLPFPASGTLTLNGTDYTVGRKVMAYGTMWYYVETDGSLVYGDNTGYLGGLTLANNVTCVHLWQGDALGSDGRVYRLTASSGTVTASAYNDYLMPQTAPAIWNSGSVHVYNGFSLVGTVRLPDLRAFNVSGHTEYVHKDQAVYDGILLTRGGTTTYFGLLTPDGKLDAKNGVRFPSNVANDPVVEMSNTLGYSGQAVVLRYADDVIVWDFVKGEAIFPVASNEEAGTASFFDFFMGEVMSLFSLFTDEVEDGYEQSKQLQSGVAADAFLGEDSHGQIDPDMELGEEGEPTGETLGEGTSSASSDEPGEDGTGEGGDGEGGLSGTSGESSASASGGSSGGAAGSGGAYVSGAARGEILRSALGDTIVAYSPETGRYEQMDTATLALGDLEKAVLSRRADERDEETAQKDPSSGFQVKDTGNRSLYASEKQGVTLLVITAAAAALTLLALAVLAIRKRKDK